MKYNIENNINNNKYECLLLNIYQNIIDNNNFFYNKYILKAKKKYNYKGKINENIIINNINNNNIDNLILIGCGKKEKLNKKIFLNIIKNSFYMIKKNNYKNILIIFNNLNIKNNYWKTFNYINTFEYYNYNFNKFKTKKYNLKNNKNIYFYINKKKENNNINLAINNAKIISLGIKKSRDLCNTPPNICNSKYIYKIIKKNIKNNNNIKISYLNKKKMKEIGMNAYLSVNKSSSNEPLAIIINYNKNNKEKPIILIGKGITFDTGGISIKPSNKMWDMKYDMSGASSVYGILYIISKLKLNINVIGILACAENMIDKNSTRPGDVIKTLSKKTVEIINTDAEGRLILCDILSYINKFNPYYVIDIATLTGACLISLGPKINALLTNNKKLSKKIISASKESMNNIWELPLFNEYNKYLKSNIADIKNCSETPYAGTITAACFLSYFTKKYKWAHIDIAGTAYNKNGSTGQPICIIVQFLINLFNKK